MSTFPDTLLKAYSVLGDRIANQCEVGGVLAAVTQVAVSAVPGAEFASITRRHGVRFASSACTAPAAERADRLQYEVGNGPCVDAVEKDHVFVSRDVAADARWPVFGPLAAERVGVHSALSIRMVLDDDDAMAGMNLYSRRIGAFDDHSLEVGRLLAAHGAVAVSRAIAKEKSANLELALRTSREIGIAVGVLMSRHKCTRDDAFDLLRLDSQHTHRKLRDIAAEVAETGDLPFS